MKYCKQCKTEKPLTDFYKYNENSYFGKCKECVKSNVKNNYRKNIDHYKEYELKRNSTDKRKEQQKKYSIKRVIENPIQRAANIMVGNAIRDKKLIRPDNCSNCGILCVPDGHHDDYAYPLSVTWLCRQCHNDWHKINTPLNGVQ